MSDENHKANGIPPDNHLSTARVVGMFLHSAPAFAARWDRDFPPDVLRTLHDRLAEDADRVSFQYGTSVRDGARQLEWLGSRPQEMREVKMDESPRSFHDLLRMPVTIGSAEIDRKPYNAWVPAWLVVGIGLYVLLRAIRSR